MTILEQRSYYKPFDYPWAFDAFQTQNKMHWIPEEVPMSDDIRDWNHKLTDQEKNLLTQIFRFFTQADIDVAGGYYDKFLPLFKKPELRMMMGSFAGMEGIHIEAYSKLIDSIGMPETEYQAFSQYEEMAEKHSFVAQFNSTSDVAEVAKALAVYSAFTEGLQLFSSFAILLNFPRQNKMKGMGQIVTWSIADESLHVKYMIKVFNTLIEECPQIWTKEFRKQLYEICNHMVYLEDRFIDLAFSQGGIEDLEKDDVKKYIRYIADRRLNQLNLNSEFLIDKNPLPWLEWIVNGQEHTNFFENRPTAYSKGNLVGSWDKVWSSYS